MSASGGRRAVRQIPEGLFSSHRSVLVFLVLAVSLTGIFSATQAAVAVAAEWSTQSVPNPPLNLKAVLLDVACPSTSVCVAVGKDNTPGNSFGRVWEGGTWT